MSRVHNNKCKVSVWFQIRVSIVLDLDHLPRQCKHSMCIPYHATELIKRVFLSLEICSFCKADFSQEADENLVSVLLAFYVMIYTAK